LRLATAERGPYLARIRPGNTASRRAFEAAGFHFTHRSGDMEWFRKDPEDRP
jgi:RimJ/RimL family protein N-acetyltransferase